MSPPFRDASSPRSGPESKQRTKALLFAAAKLASFAKSLGVGLEVDTVLVAAFHRALLGLSTDERADSAHVEVNLAISPPMCLDTGRLRRACPASGPRPPIQMAEIARFLALADAQPTPARCHKASALICLCAGAGLHAGELRAVVGTDVVVRSGGVLVLVGGKRPRAVPVLMGFQERLLEAAELCRCRLHHRRQRR